MARTRRSANTRAALEDPSLPPTLMLETPQRNPDSDYDWKGWVSQEQPVEVDLGCGMGRFLIARASRFPDIRYLGVERESARLARIDLAGRRLNLENLRIIRADALDIVERLLPDGSVSHMYVFFPDPWPKRRHWRRRILSPALLNGAWRVLQKGGGLHIATDQKELFDIISTLLKTDDKRFSLKETLTRDEDEYTDFEVIFRGKGMPIYEISYKRL